MEEGLLTTQSTGKQPNLNSKTQPPSKFEEALEIKALRRILNAYLNYSDAAEDDVRRWERSYAKLLPQHKEIVMHLQKKYQQVRRCISSNSFFIFNMLQAFEPPFDINQDENVEIHENYHHSQNAVPQLEGRQLEVPRPFQMHDIVSVNAKGTQPSKISEEHLFLSKDGVDSNSSCVMLNTSLRKISSGNSRSNEMTVAAADVRGGRNLCHISSSSDDHDSTSFMENDIKKTVDFDDGCKSTSIPSHNYDPIAITKHNASDTTCKSMMCNQRESCGCCMNKPNISGDGEREVSIQRSCHSMPVSNGEVNYFAFDWKDPAFQLRVSPADVDKVRCILRNIVRDWAPEGELERKQCYQPILEELEWRFPNRSKDKLPSCLVPGAGLARLALEISRLGFVSQGNEFSYYMMICSSFILNHTQEPMEWVIYPWIHSNCNSLSDEDQLRPVYFPDLHPGSAGITEGFSMCAGDFVEVYGDPSQSGVWDAVATCFFIDTAHNVIEYIEIISNVLKDGGVWINLGPLLYHFADIYAPEDEMSIELSLEDVKRIAFNYGFELETERIIETTYTANPRSMMQNRYFAAFWTMIKKGSRA